MQALKVLRSQEVESVLAHFLMYQASALAGSETIVHKIEHD